MAGFATRIRIMLNMSILANNDAGDSIEWLMGNGIQRFLIAYKPLDLSHTKPGKAQNKIIYEIGSSVISVCFFMRDASLGG